MSEAPPQSTAPPQPDPQQQQPPQPTITQPAGPPPLNSGFQAPPSPGLQPQNLQPGAPSSPMLGPGTPQGGPPSPGGYYPPPSPQQQLQGYPPPSPQTQGYYPPPSPQPQQPPQPGQYPPPGQQPQQWQQPPPGGNFYPQQPGYGAPPPQGQWPQQPPPPQQGQWPQQPGPYPPQGQWPQQPGPYPPQGQWPQQPMQGYPPQPGYPYPPPAGPYGYPPPQQATYNPQAAAAGSTPTARAAAPKIVDTVLAFPVAAPCLSPGYNSKSIDFDPRYAPEGTQASKDMERVVVALQKFNMDETTVAGILSERWAPLECGSRAVAFLQARAADPKFAKKQPTLADVARSAKYTADYGFKALTIALCGGPLEFDAWVVKRAVAGAGTNEEALEHVLLGRSNGDLAAIMDAYAARNGRTLLADVLGEFGSSPKTQEFYKAVLSASRRHEDPNIPIDVSADVSEIQLALEKSPPDMQVLLAYFVHGSEHRLRSISERVRLAELESWINKANWTAFGGDLGRVLKKCLWAVAAPAKLDARFLHKAFNTSSGKSLAKMMGADAMSKDELIAIGIVKLLWRIPPSPTFFRDVEHSFCTEFRGWTPMPGQLANAVRNETKGDTEDFLIALVGKHFSTT